MWVYMYVGMWQCKTEEVGSLGAGFTGGYEQVGMGTRSWTPSSVRALLALKW